MCLPVEFFTQNVTKQAERFEKLIMLRAVRLGEAESAGYIVRMPHTGQCCLGADLKEITSQCFTVIEFVKCLF